ncbi:hypothetical protein LSH36_269g10013 [Paralvinella palmiformis]|uniref:PDZ domain-containing protein n=1 Tax=Paralvinella palmiformis TaxID=53620 RepID=A0AAD9N275_9ANNE|nr:hypothetical protein LSH36_269g10013 [Paralvinella palmiformis]
MAEIDVLKAQIVRQDLSTPWGFVLQGGVDQGSPLKIQSLLPGSPAARIGLKTGDEVTEVGDIQTEGLTYQQVQDLIEKHGDTLILTVERRARGSVPINPVINATETEPLKEYQPYDMTGAQQHPAPVSVSQSSPKASDTKQAANPEAANHEGAPKTAAGSTSIAGSASTVETAPATKSAEGKSPPAGDDVSVTESKSAVEPVSAIECSPAVELAQEVPEAGIKEAVPHVTTGVPSVTELAPLPKPLTIATTITEEARNLHYEQTVNVQPQVSTTKQRRRVRTRPKEATNIQPPSGPISQIVQGAYTPPFAPSKFKPEVQTEVYYPGIEPKPEPIRSYQPYDMSGSRSYQPADTQVTIY